jgi:hypothetical protein
MDKIILSKKNLLEKWQKALGIMQKKDSLIQQ